MPIDRIEVVSIDIKCRNGKTTNAGCSCRWRYFLLVVAVQVQSFVGCRQGVVSHPKTEGGWCQQTKTQIVRRGYDPRWGATKARRILVSTRKTSHDAWMAEKNSWGCLYWRTYS